MDVLHRLRKSLWPFCTKSALFDDEDKIDLYGPIWIMITLIVEIAIAGYVVYQIEEFTLPLEYKNSRIDVSKYTFYNLEKVARAGFVCLGYFIINPLMVLLLVKYILWVSDIEYLWIFAVYGYSFTVFIIATALSMVPIDWLKWVFLATSGVVSLFFIAMEMYTYLKFKMEQGHLKFIFVLIYLAGSHFVFVVALKNYFLA